MNLEQLIKFCAKDDIRSYLLNPWIQGEYVVASNGHIAVRVPATDFVSVLEPVTGKVPLVDSLIDKVKALELALMPIPELPPTVPCEYCGGSGAAYPCDECDGSGNFDHCGREYACKACDGHGQNQIGEGDAEPCWFCDGRGEKPYYAVQVGDGYFDRRYLAIIASLPNVVIAPNGPKGTAYFTFDGGDGALMPMLVDPPLNPPSTNDKD